MISIYRRSGDGSSARAALLVPRSKCWGCCTLPYSFKNAVVRLPKHYNWSASTPTFQYTERSGTSLDHIRY